MIIDMSYWTRVLRRVIYVILILLGLFLAFKLSIFYMPFLISFIISLMIEPAIRFFMKKLKFTRKTSSIIIFNNPVKKFLIQLDIEFNIPPVEF